MARLYPLVRVALILVSVRWTLLTGLKARVCLDVAAAKFQTFRPIIVHLVDTKVESLSSSWDQHDRASLAEKILDKSKGSFLWTIFVINELSKSYGVKEINKLLEDVPQGMGPLYKRILDLMTQATRGKGFAKAVLAWATCATRPLTTAELDGALRLDLKDYFPRSIAALWGQLITIEFGKVQMVHETAREFLLDTKLESEFAVNKTQAHMRIARACLSSRPYLLYLLAMA